ncbi:MAG: MBL fold metallo-hydrolase [Anaerolineae bacterium]|nr:MBL fold metallo-hydrolase [Anaerolineae bacterium]
MPEPILQKLTNHIYWMPPAPPDRPSLCAVVGERFTLMLDAASSDAHARLFLDQLAQNGIASPRLIALTHWHWDHVFGAAEIGVPIIAHRLTAQELAIQAAYEWTDSTLDQRVLDGLEIAFCADNIKLELPEPRNVRIPLPNILLDDTLDIDLGGVTCHLRHVGGDHAADSVVAYIPEDRLLFLGDSLYDAVYTPVRHYTTARLFPLLNKLLAFEAQLYIEGHTDKMLTRAEIEAIAAKMRLAGDLIAELGTDEAAILAAARLRTGAEPDEDMTYFVKGLIAGI